MLICKDAELLNKAHTKKNELQSIFSISLPFGEDG